MTRNRDYPLYEREEYETLSQMVWEKAQKCGNKIAFQYRRGKNIFSVTYREYLDDVLSASKYLSKHSNGRSHIAILGENSYQWLVIFMATVMNGNVVVPLDKELDAAGIGDLLTHSNSQICVYSDAYSDIAERLSGDCSVTFLSMRAAAEARKIGGTNDTVPKEWRDTSKHNAAAIFYTSGTSGKSKGVMLSQENMMADINFACKNFFLSGDTLAVLPFHHAFGLLTSVFAPFNYEHTVFINPSLKNVKRDMLEAKPQMMMLVPLFVETFYKTIWQTAKKQGAERKLRLGITISNFLLRLGIDIRKILFRSVLSAFGGKLEYIICGGASLQEKYVQEFRSMGIEVLNGYGITECSPVVATNRNLYHRDGSVGQILKDCQVRIQKGEIQIQGKNVMLGYYQDEAATQDAFEGNWFRTGDLGHIDTDGFLFITGRAKNLIVLSNGENVSPEELENLLLDHEMVKEALVYAENEVITAEIFPNPEADLGSVQKQLQDIVDTCNRRLPVYKRIQRLKVRQAEFQKTTTQKIKR
mgnify:CR=1 FL=1